ncbi:hypothetical protein GQ600_23488 [Phytophthora cactorum]|nr:hypothetical protein GQ600_23488 [Phytophthora cactorum]
MASLKVSSAPQSTSGTGGKLRHVHPWLASIARGGGHLLNLSSLASKFNQEILQGRSSARQYRVREQPDWCTALLAIDELAAAREMEYRRERDAQRRQDEVRREEQEKCVRSAVKNARGCVERFLALIAQIAKKQD